MFTPVLLIALLYASALPLAEAAHATGFLPFDLYQRWCATGLEPLVWLAENCPAYGRLIMLASML